MDCGRGGTIMYMYMYRAPINGVMGGWPDTTSR